MAEITWRRQWNKIQGQHVYNVTSTTRSDNTQDSSSICSHFYWPLSTGEYLWVIVDVHTLPSSWSCEIHLSQNSYSSSGWSSVQSSQSSKKKTMVLHLTVNSTQVCCTFRLSSPKDNATVALSNATCAHLKNLWKRLRACTSMNTARHYTVPLKHYLQNWCFNVKSTPRSQHSLQLLTVVHWWQNPSAITDSKGKDEVEFRHTTLAPARQSLWQLCSTNRPRTANLLNHKGQRFTGHSNQR